VRKRRAEPSGTGATAVDRAFIGELFRDFGPVEMRRMFGGVGLYADGVMFALVAGGVIYLKADAGSVPDFERESCTPFAYQTKGGRRAVLSYRRLPDRLYDEPQELALWARKALQVALRNTARKAAGVLKRSRATQAAKTNRPLTPRHPNKKSAKKRKR